MSVVNTGGPAFPITRIGYDGMSLRDYFAGQALAGFASRMDSEDRRRYRTGAAAGYEAAAAYALADAMIEARSFDAALPVLNPAAPDLFDSLTEFVALYDGSRDMLGPDIRHKLARAEAALRKAGAEIPVKEGT